jgi:hypothetical protein
MSAGETMTVRRQGLLLFSLLMVCYSYVHQPSGANQKSRLDLLHALCVQKTVQIDAYHQNTIDKSFHDGHYYSDKAPGIAFLAAPAFLASAGLLKLLRVPLDSEPGWLVSSWITTVGSVGLLTALGAVALFVFLANLVPPRFAFGTVLVVFVGAAPFPYATMLFSHSAVVGLICIALWAIADPVFFSRFVGAQPESGGQPVSDAQCRMSSLSANPRTLLPAPAPPPRPFRPEFPWTHLLAGLCCGFAVASEYTAATAAEGVLLLAFLSGFKRGLAVAIGAIPPLLLIPAYNAVCFGGPLAFGYHHLAMPEFQEMNKGLFGITFPPKSSAAYLLLFSPGRGLFFWTPFFVCALMGARKFCMKSPALFATALGFAVLHVLFISGYYMPSGGWALGPRHLAPIIPFLAVGAAFGFARFPFLGFQLGYLSLLLTGLATLIDAMPPEHSVLDFYLRRLAEFSFAPNLGRQLGLPPFAGILLILPLIMVPYFVLAPKRPVPP